jgi:hypothetical protein
MHYSQILIVKTNAKTHLALNLNGCTENFLKNIILLIPKLI